jgi:hypothetical protein
MRRWVAEEGPRPGRIGCLPSGSAVGPDHRGDRRAGPITSGHDRCMRSADSGRHAMSRRTAAMPKVGTTPTRPLPRAGGLANKSAPLYPAQQGGSPDGPRAPGRPRRVPGSVLRALLVESSRARAVTLAGTYTTGSPAATSSWAMPRPRPMAPSTAIRCSKRHVAREVFGAVQTDTALTQPA